MKKTLLFTSLILSSSLAFAQYTGSNSSYNSGGYNGPSSFDKPISIKAAKGMRDDTDVKVQGKITKQIGKEKYLLKDSSGEIIVEIDDDKWYGLSINATDTVEIIGEIDKDWNSVELDADHIRKITQ